MCDDAYFLDSFTDGVRTILLDQEQSGTDLLTDGCLRYDLLSPAGSIASWDSNNVAYIGGLCRVPRMPVDKQDIATTLLKEDSRYGWWKITGLSPDTVGNWWLVEDEPYVHNLDLWTETVKIALANSKKIYKFSGPSAAQGAQRCINLTGKSDRDIYYQLMRVENQVLREISKIGCKVIQVDYPFGFAPWTSQFHKLPKDVWKDLVDASNEEIKGVNANIWFHFCWGAPIHYSHKTPSQEWSMAKVYPDITESKGDCIQAEAANTDGKFLDEELEAWKENLSEKDYAVGAATPYDLLETANDVDKIVNLALKHVPPEKLALSTDEGLSGHGAMTRKGALIKLRLLADAASKARKNV
jgi:methionine synthase II (cobalamin-independent)